MPHSTYRDLAVCLDISQKRVAAVRGETLPENMSLKVVTQTLFLRNNMKKSFFFSTPVVPASMQVTKSLLVCVYYPQDWTYL